MTFIDTSDHRLMYVGPVSDRGRSVSQFGP